MNADGNATQLINQTINSFNINPDKLAISRIGESISTLDQARELRVRESEDALKSSSLTLRAPHALASHR